MSVAREQLGHQGVWLVMRCDTVNCDTKPIAFPAFWSAEIARDRALFWYHDDAKNCDLCPDCYLIHGTGEAQPLGILNGTATERPHRTKWALR